MIQNDKDRINSYVALKSPNDLTGFLVVCQIMNFGFPLMVCGFGMQLKTNVPTLTWVIFYIAYGIMIIWNAYLLRNVYDRQVQTLLNSGVSCFIYAAQFLTWFYFLGRYKAGYSPEVLILSLLGVIGVIAILFIYRIRVYKGLAKNRAGTPNYSGIVATTLIFGGIIKLLLSNNSAETTIKFVVFGCLFVSCAFAVGILSIHQYYIATRFRDQIILYEKPKVKKRSK